MGWIEETLQPNGTLKNKLGIKDKNRLAEIELRMVTIKYEHTDEIEIVSIDDLKRIHKWLFGDIYDWAGVYRPGDFQKGSTVFFPRDRFPLAIENLNQQISHIIKYNYTDDHELATNLARLLLDINNFHPFREGNGSSQRLFITVLARQKGKTLNLSKVTNSYRHYMSDKISDDVQTMTSVIYRAIK